MGHASCVFNSEQNLTTADRKEETSQKRKNCPQHLHVKSICVALIIVTIVLAAGVTIPVVLGVMELEVNAPNLQIWNYFYPLGARRVNLGLAFRTTKSVKRIV